MQTPFGSAGVKPEEAFAGAAERFFELLRTFGLPPAGKAPDWSSLTAPLAREFEQWLRLSQSAAPWFAAAAGAAGAGSTGAAAAPGGTSSTASSPWPFGALPLGPMAAQGRDTQRLFELLGRLAQLQGQLAVHWSEIAQAAARRFVARLGGAAAVPATPEQALKLYELWVNCAEEAYAATVHQDEFSRLQAELANTWAALLVEQRRHAETLVRAFGLPSRAEVDALAGQLQELRRQLAELADVPRPRPSGGQEPAAHERGTHTPRPAPPRRAKRAAGKASNKRAAGKASNKRARSRRPRR
jgi:Poly(R)-hydroxyalkanoic acid synthase subunit (PHA_synth_III_E)